MTTPENPTAPFVITLFGPIQVMVDSHPLPRLRSRKCLWLLALLSLRHDRPVEREWLAGTLWPDTDQSQAFANLRPIVSELRRGLGIHSERLQSPDRHTLFLDLAGAEVDILAFDVAIAGRTLSHLAQAVGLYRGTLLEGCTEEWVFQERNAREQQCLQALQKLGDAALTAGDCESAIGHYQRAVSLDPRWDTARRGLMEALARNGDSNAALHVYREFTNLLRTDTNAVPDEQTSALYRRLRGEMRQQMQTPAVVATKEVSARGVTGYLPHPLTELIGREDERVEVAVLLRRSRLVTLTGIGGIGKTRLAMEVTREAVREYPDGVWLVALDALSEGRSVVPQIASVLGVKEEQGYPLQDRVTEHLGKKQLLLVLDNCEHVLEASAQVAAHLLRECEAVRILATSREALGITGEACWTVPALAVPTPAHLPKGQATLLRVLMGYESVHLFVERAQAVNKSFALKGSTALTVAHVCCQLEGIPFALELAAALVKSLTVDQIAARLDNKLGLLIRGSRTAQARQQTLRATLDWSYALLSEPERLMLHRLSVFAGGWTLEAAEAVCCEEGIETSRVLDLLTALVDKSLVAYEDREQEACGRYRLLEMVRQYAAEYMQASGEEDRIRGRHRRWLVALAEEADPQLHGAEQGKWLDRLEAEHDNLRATLAWNGPEAAAEESELRLVGALWQFWVMRAHYTDGRRYLLQALERPANQKDSAARAKAFTGAGAIAYQQGDYAESRTRHQQSRSISHKLGRKQAIAASLANEGMAAWSQGDYTAARTLLEESLSIHRDLDNKGGIAATADTLGHLVQWQGNYAAARILYEESNQLHTALGNRRGTAFSLENFGNLALLQGDYRAARTLFEESLSIRKEIEDKYGIALSLGNLGVLAKEQGDFDAARPLFEECVTVFEELGDRDNLAQTLGNLGVLAKEKDNYKRSQELLEKGLTLFRQSGNQDGVAFCLCNLGKMAADQGDSKTARTLLTESLSVRRTMGNRQGMAENLEGLAVVMLLRAEPKQAVRMWGMAHAVRESIGAPLPLYEQARYDTALGEARSVMDKDAFKAAWEMGCTQSLEEALLQVDAV